MKKGKKLILILVSCTIFVLAISCFEKDLSPIEKSSKSFEWLTDFETAKKIATEQNLSILANFTGSDWCPWCIKLEQEVFSTPEFKEFAGKNLVLLLIDFPSKKKLPEEQATKNRDLANKYRIEGLPTILLLDPQGNVIGRTGYQEGGAKAYIEHLKTLLTKKNNH